MKKRWIDDLSKRKIITFYYPLDDLAETLMKETSYRVKLIMDAGHNVPGGLIFDPEGDKRWMEHELPNILAAATNVFGKMSYGINPDIALFYDKEIEQGVPSAGFSVNDYGRQRGSHLKSLDSIISSMIVNSLLFRWFVTVGYGDTAQYYQAEATASAREMYKGIDLLKRKKKMIKYPMDDHEYYPEDYNMKGALKEFLNTKPQDDVS